MEKGTPVSSGVICVHQGIVKVVVGNVGEVNGSGPPTSPVGSHEKRLPAAAGIWRTGKE